MQQNHRIADQPARSPSLHRKAAISHHATPDTGMQPA
jgi:hypothetical protein